jgi:RNA polymerase subunit RPABC4/transcription elongation factor Spt4
MSEEEIKSLRFSFTNPYREDLPKHRVNQFGHTILSENEDFNPADMNIEVDENGEISANPKMSILDSEQFSKLVDRHMNQNDFQPDDIEPVDVRTVESDLLTRLIAELDDIKEDKSKPFLKPESSNIHIVEESSNIASTGYKSCLNKQCLYGLPKDAKFCLKCGTAQLSQFCTECGYSFPGMEKFCPDCGTKR